MNLKKVSILLQTIFYSFAGLNHFFNPNFYYPLIPDFFVFKFEINILAGIIEIILGIGSYFLKTRKLASYLIMLMLIGFIISHVHFILIGSCLDSSLCVHPVVSYIRLLIIQPILIYWAYSNSKNETLI